MAVGREYVIVCTVAASLLAGTALAAPSLGDKAPTVVVNEWITTKPPVLPGQPGSEKNVYVVEFWATWCGPCKVSIPHLAKMHEKLKDKGVVVIGLSNEEPETIQGFIKKGTKMPYHVASYEEDSDTAKWMEGVQGIPQAYVVDQKGLVVWAGHPMDGLDAVVEKVLTGKFSLEAEKQRIARMKQAQKLMNELQMAYRAEEYDKALDIVNRIIEADPKQIQPHFIKRQLLERMKRPAADLAEAVKQLEAAVSDNAEALMQVAQIEMSRPELGDRDARLALRTARRAVEVSDPKTPAAYQTLAAIQAELGMIDAAIASQQKAIELMKDAEPDELKAANKTLDYFKTAKALAAEQAAKP